MVIMLEEERGVGRCRGLWISAFVTEGAADCKERFDTTGSKSCDVRDGGGWL